MCSSRKLAHSLALSVIDYLRWQETVDEFDCAGEGVVVESDVTDSFCDLRGDVKHFEGGFGELLQLDDDWREVCEAGRRQA